MRRESELDEDEEDDDEEEEEEALDEVRSLGVIAEGSALMGS